MLGSSLPCSHEEILAAFSSEMELVMAELLPASSTSTPNSPARLLGRFLGNHLCLLLGAEARTGAGAAAGLCLCCYRR
jgi:hypothetical protein